jgi:hypothetical protein
LLNHLGEFQLTWYGSLRGAARPGSGTTFSATEFLAKKIRLEKQRKGQGHKPLDASDLRDTTYVKVRLGQGEG